MVVWIFYGGIVIVKWQGFTVINHISMLTWTKFALEIEYNICKSTNNEIYFNEYKFIYDSLYEYSKCD